MLTDSQALSLFGAFSSQPALFHQSREAMRKAAVDVLINQIKHKDCGLGQLRVLRDVVGLAPMLAVLDEMKTPSIVALVKKLDKANGTKAAGETSWARMHMASLVEGSAEPSTAPAKKVAQPKKKAPAKPIVRTLHQTKSMGGGS
jgi:hypothetical protein